MREIKFIKDTWFISGAAGIQTQIYLSLKSTFTSLHFKNPESKYSYFTCKEGAEWGGNQEPRTIGKGNRV